MGFRSPQLPVRETVSVVAAAVLTHVSSLVTHEVASLKKNDSGRGSQMHRTACAINRSSSGCMQDIVERGEYGLQSYWYRIEWQQRGIPHVHVQLIFKLRSQSVCCNRAS
jgi:hypothetical protein